MPIKMNGNFRYLAKTRGKKTNYGTSQNPVKREELYMFSAGFRGESLRFSFKKLAECFAETDVQQVEIRSVVGDRAGVRGFAVV